MGRSIIAVIAGYLAMFLGVALGITLLIALFSGAFPEQPGPYEGPSYVLVIELGFSLLAAMGGGYVCAWVAGRKERAHALGLVGVMVVLGIVSAFAEAGLKPVWSSVALVVLSPLGVLVGAGLRRRHRETAALANR